MTNRFWWIFRKFDCKVNWFPDYMLVFRIHKFIFLKCGMLTVWVFEISIPSVNMLIAIFCNVEYKIENCVDNFYKRTFLLRNLHTIWWTQKTPIYKQFDGISNAIRQSRLFCCCFLSVSVGEVFKRWRFVENFHETLEFFEQKTIKFSRTI